MKTLDRLFWPLLVAFIVCVAIVVVVVVLPALSNQYGVWLDFQSFVLKGM